MHVVVLTLNRGRGSGCVARDQAASLLAAGHRVTYLYAGMSERVMGADNIDVQLHSPTVPVHEYLPAAEADQLRVSSMSAAVARRYTADFVAALSAIDGVDLIVAHHATITSVAARVVAKSRHIPYVVFAHGTGIEPRHHGGYADQIWDAIAGSLVDASGIIVTTDYVRDSLVRPLVDVPVSRFIVLPCGVDSMDFEPPPGTDIKAKYKLPERYVVCPGALTYAKGPQNVVAASSFYADLAPTIFIGDGDIADELESALGSRGRLLGYVPTVDKDALIKAATVLTAAPVKREHFGIIYVEAMAAGAVPVAYSGGGVDSIVLPDCGVLTQRAPRALGTAIRSLLLDDWRRTQLAAAGQLRARAEFDKSVLGRRFVEFAKSLAMWSPAEAVG
ncbi:MAG: glycosyltransferase family 4 protein [Acidimicrobiia bacterium]|nr:glycosyltransferase family 4 protein [Acidimicrobiia bacterium]